MYKNVSIDNIYSLIRKNDELSNVLIDCLFIQNWFNSIFDFDPVTNKPLSSTNDYLFSRINNIETSVSKFWWNDRIENIVRFTETAVFNLFSTLHNKIVSEHIITHSNRVKETDSTSIRWLSKKPGRTVRQKIADSGKMMGVFHIASIDTTENRLLKAFLMRMDNILYEKEQLAHHLNFSIPDNTSNFIIQVHRWLKSEDASCIGTWNNSFPNNTLLNDKNYRKIWNAWCSLQQINEFLKEDISKIEHLKCIYYFWNRVAELSIHPNYRLLQAPVFRSEDSLDIDSYFPYIAGWYIQDGPRKSVSFELKQESKCISIIKNGYVSLEKIPELSYSHKKRGSESKVYSADCCAFDLTTIKPYFATSTKKNGTLDSRLIYQTWESKESKDKKIDVDCSNSKMISIEHALNTITIHDYFRENFLGDEINPSSVASIFAESIRKQLNANLYIYLLPDELDDFSKMQIALRHQLNVKFSNISPLPRSIAKIFQIYEKEGVEILSKKFFIVDKFDNYWIITKVIPKKSDLLLKKYPESDGIIFEHFPSTVIYKDEVEKDVLFTLKDTKQLHNDFTLDEDHVVPLDGTLSFSEMEKKLGEFRKKQSEDFEYISVTPNDNLTLGAISYYKFQKETPDVVLWREHLPPLRLETSGQKLILVDETTEGISPKKGEEKEIPVKLKFEMPAGKDFYEFSLYKGERKEKSKYYAYLTNESFPLSKNIVCKLKLTFTYGDEQPYKLKFIPDDKGKKLSFNYIFVKWETESHQDHRKLPFPDFCNEYTWEDMRHYKTKKNGKDILRNFIDEWLHVEFQKIINLGKIYIIQNLETSIFNEKENYFSTEVELLDPDRRLIKTCIQTQRELKSDDKIVYDNDEKHTDFIYYLFSEMKISKIKQILHNPACSNRLPYLYKTNAFLEYNNKNVYCYVNSRTQSIKPGDKVITTILNTQKGYKGVNTYLLSELENRVYYKVKEIAKNTYHKSDKSYKSTVVLDLNTAEIHRNPNVKIISEKEIQKGDTVICFSVTHKKHFKLLEEVDYQFKESLRFPIITVWNNGRSIEDNSVSIEFKEMFYKARDAALNLVIDPSTNDELKNEMLFFLCAIHKDSPSEIYEWFIPSLLKRENYTKYDYPKFLSYAIGDCSLTWQEDILKEVINYLSDKKLRAYSIQILATSLWRTNDIIYKISQNSIGIIINAIHEEFKHVLYKLKKNENDNLKKYKYGILYTNCLETLLAILRLRNTEEISSLEILSPFYNKNLKSCYETIVNISKMNALFVKNRFSFSNGLELQKAVEIYINGDLGENEIKILSIEEEI